MQEKRKGKAGQRKDQRFQKIHMITWKQTGVRKNNSYGII